MRWMFPWKQVSEPHVGFILSEEGTLHPSPFLGSRLRTCRVIPLTEGFEADISRLEHTLRAAHVQAVHILAWKPSPNLKRLLEALKDYPVGVYIVWGVRSSHMFIPQRIEKIFDTSWQGWRLKVKRGIDIVGALVALALFAPLMLLIAVLIKVTSPGPVLFRQTRCGWKGQPFVIYKFRTMHVEAESHGPQAQRQDPRVTRVGYWLRRLSLDELPQLFNVLKGDMSLVGPRPFAWHHHEQYRRKMRTHGFMRRYLVKPGMTGWAQIHGYRGEILSEDELKKRVEYDLEYVQRGTLRTDLRILLRTIWQGFYHPKAY